MLFMLAKAAESTLFFKPSCKDLNASALTPGQGKHWNWGARSWPLSSHGALQTWRQHLRPPEALLTPFAPVEFFQTYRKGLQRQLAGPKETVPLLAKPQPWGHSG